MARIYKLLPIKLNRAAGVLSKIWHYAPKFLLRTIYFSIFNSHLIYICQICSQKENTIKKLLEIQDKSVHIISFKDKNNPTSKLCYINKVLKIADYIKLLNCLFIKNMLSNNHLPIFVNLFKKQVKLILTQLDMLPQTRYSYHSPKQINMESSPITYQTAYTWYDLQNKLGIYMLEESNSKVKTALAQLYFNNYLN